MLEAELGVRWLQRTTRAMVLTEAGEAYLARVLPLIDELARARDEATSLRTDPAGTLRLTASVAFGQECLVPLLSELRSTFPRLKFELLFTDTNLDLVAERIDLAIRLAPSFRADVVGVRLFPTRYRIVASPDYLAREGGIRTPDDLGVRPCLLMSLPGFRSRWLLRRGAETWDVPVQGDVVMSSALPLRAAAVAGLGPALLADWLVRDDLAAGRLVDAMPDHEATATTFDTAAWLLYPSRDHLPRKVRSIMDFLRQRWP